MATPASENLNPAASDVIKCVVKFYGKGSSHNNFIRKENFGGIANLEEDP